MSYNYVVTLPDGGVVKRRGSARVYTHIVIVKRPVSFTREGNKMIPSPELKWAIASWHLTNDAANKALCHLKSRHKQIDIMEVTAVPVVPRKVANVKQT